MGHRICFGKRVCLQPDHESASGAHLMLGDPPKHMGPQGISTAELKPRQAKGQLGLSEGQWGPARQQELEKRELPWADRLLPSLGVLWVAQLIIPHHSWQGQHPKASAAQDSPPLLDRGLPKPPKLPRGVSVACAIPRLVPQTLQRY